MMNDVFLKICKIDKEKAKEIVDKVYGIAKTGSKIAWEKYSDYWKKWGYTNFNDKWLEDIAGKGTILDRWKHGHKIELNDLYKAWVENLFVRARGTATYRKIDEEEGKLEKKLKEVTHQFNPFYSRGLLSEKDIFKLMDKKKSWDIRKNYNNGHPGIAKAIMIGADLLTRYSDKPKKCAEELLKEISEADEKYDLEMKWNYVEKYVTGKDVDGSGKIHELGNIPMVNNAIFCSFLLRIGVKNFVKPDYALRQLFCKDDFIVFFFCDRLAKFTKKYPRTIDKIFWLVKSDLAVTDHHIDEDYRKSEWEKISNVFKDIF